MPEPPRRFPPPWHADPTPGGYVVRDANGQALAYLYSRDNDAEARQAKVLTKDEARRIAINIARLPELLDSVAAALCDEIAFWRSDESTNPDTEILAALRPAMATIPNAMLLCASSPYARRGSLWDAYRRYYGTDDPTV